MVFLTLGKSLLRKGVSKKSLRLAGIRTKRFAFIGPDEVHIDLTNRCNNECIGCWCRSRFLEEKRMDERTMDYTLSYPRLKEIIQELAELGCRRIKLIGGGEPFMHPHIMDIISDIKEKGMECAMNSNFNLLTPSMVQQLVDLQVDLIDVSMWAGDADTYCATHLNQSREDFGKIKETLKYLKECKDTANSKLPLVRMYNVILNKNHTALMAMVDFAFETQVDMIQFNHIDTVEDKTTHLLLDSSQKEELKKECSSIESYVDFSDPRTTRQCAILKKENIEIELHSFFSDFIRRVDSSSFEQGNYDETIFNHCYVGWLFARIMADGSVIPCLKAHKLPSGNIMARSFTQIWNGAAQQQFRKKGNNIKKNSSYFKKVGNDPSFIGCFRTCDNLYQNEEIMAHRNHGKRTDN